MSMTRADHLRQIAQIDEEAQTARADLAVMDTVLVKLEAQLEQAREPEANYLATYRRLSGERDRLMVTHDCRVIDNSAAHVSVIAGSRPVPRDVERRIVELCRLLRQLEVDRQDALRNGLVTIAGASSRLERARIDRALLAARVASLEG